MPVWLQWGHRLSAVETRRLAQAPSPYGPRFNGATAFRQWKLPRGASHPNARPASMGPPPFGSGNTRYPTKSKSLLVELQWGHRLSAVETLECLAGELEGLMMLQWGHRLSAVETRRASPPSCQGGTCFNGATAFRQWKQGGAYPWIPSFNGATAFRQWKLRCGWYLLDGVPASMGPPPFGSGNIP